MSAPAELFDADMGAEHWLRVDLYPTRGKALAAAAYVLDAPFVELRARKTWCREDDDYAREALADGIAEPYDGWPWTSASEDDTCAVQYWHVERRMHRLDCGQ